MPLTKQQEFIKFINKLPLNRYMQIRKSCIDNQELAFCSESWNAFMCNNWQINETHFKIMWEIVDNTFVN